MIGRTVGHYEIRDELGSGGMGVVYRAWDRHLRRYVAIKSLPPQTISSLASRQRLRREALALSKLNHPAVATLHDFISEPDCDCIVMELVPGQSLHELLKNGPLPESEVVHLAIPLADGLSAAHRAGVIHRDLKPANIRVTPERRPKILDFGLAKREQMTVESLTTAPTESAGIVVGTLPYIAPELWNGEPASVSSDLYALGVVLYEMATGALPFPDLVGVAIAHAAREVAVTPPRKRIPAISIGLETIILQCLQKSPGQRPPSAEALLHALEDLRSTTPSGRPLLHSGRARRASLALPLGAFAVLLTVVAGSAWWIRAHREPEVRSLGVLPLTNLSADGSQQYFADGMTDELTTRLAEFPAVRVISRTSMMRYKDTHKPVTEIARELRVDYVLQGSVKVENQRLRISVQLIDGHEDRHLWSKRYDGHMGQVLDMQDQLAQSVAREIGLKLQPGLASAASRPVDPLAYQSYLQGRFHLDRRSEEGIRRAVNYFSAAIQRDSLYAAAHAGLATAWSAAAFGGFTRPAEAYPHAKRAAERALELDPQSSEGYTALGNILQNGEWEWEAAARAYRKAIELNANNAVAHHWYANNLALRGEFEGAMSEIARAQSLDPYSLPISVGRGAFLYFARRHAEALTAYRLTAQLDSTSGLLGRAMAANFDRLGKEAEAVHSLCAWLETAAPPGFSAQVANTFRQHGLASALQLLIQALISKRSAGQYEPATHIAELFTRIGDREAAFKWFAVAVEEHDTELNRLKVDPIFDPLRADPRFRDLLHQVGLDRPVTPEPMEGA
ncbi:MAG TPA: protein kinase [Candidatus Eisenbacteria bacterium]|nr:protein kinase [Candidatus Eisenbacteria bacterium]